MKNFVIFGASGDLAKNYIFPALSKLKENGLLFDYYGYGRSSFSHPDQEYVMGNYDATGLSQLKNVLKNPDSVYYLAIPTSLELVTSILTGLKTNNMVSVNSVVVIEKPFGHDYQSAKLLMDVIKSTVGFDHVFLVDHYLTKELVKNIISLRFANPVFEHLWQQRFIDHIEIIATETRGIDNRASYYDHIGALRDMIQNHCLQLVSLIAMGQPASFDSKLFAQQKLKIINKLSLFSSFPSFPCGAVTTVNLTLSRKPACAHPEDNNNATTTIPRNRIVISCVYLPRRDICSAICLPGPIATAADLLLQQGSRCSRTIP